MSKALDDVNAKIEKIIDKEIERQQAKLAEWYERRLDSGLRYLSKEEECEENIKALTDMKNQSAAIMRKDYEISQLKDRINKMKNAMTVSVSEISKIYGLEKTVNRLRSVMDAK